MTVSGEVRIRTKSMKNVETERLLGRLQFIRENIARFGFEAEQKNDFRARVRETVNIERELARRGVEFVPVTDGQHLSVDVFAVPVMTPPPSWAERRERGET